MKTYLPTFKVVFKATGKRNKIYQKDTIFKKEKVLVEDFETNSVAWIENYIFLEYFEPTILSIERVE